MSDPPQLDEAVESLLAIRQPLEQLGSEVDMASWHRIRASAHLRAGEPDAARSAADAALAVLGDTPRLEACMARTVLGDALAGAGDHVAAEAQYRRAADTLSMM